MSLASNSDPTAVTGPMRSTQVCRTASIVLGLVKSLAPHGSRKRPFYPDLQIDISASGRQTRSGTMARHQAACSAIAFRIGYQST